MGWLMLKPSLQVGSKDIVTHNLENKGIHSFPNDICLKMNVIPRLEIELAYYVVAVRNVSHYITKTSPTTQSMKNNE